jgi:hypothetical protein
MALEVHVFHEVRILGLKRFGDRLAVNLLAEDSRDEYIHNLPAITKTETVTDAVREFVLRLVLVRDEVGRDILAGYGVAGLCGGLVAGSVAGMEARTGRTENILAALVNVGLKLVPT